MSQKAVEVNVESVVAKFGTKAKEKLANPGAIGQLEDQLRDTVGCFSLLYAAHLSHRLGGEPGIVLEGLEPLTLAVDKRGT